MPKASTTSGKQYDFDGELLTVAQLRDRYPAYSEGWIRDALKEGCRSLADFKAREYQKQRNQARSHKCNARTIALKEAQAMKFVELKSVAGKAPAPAKTSRTRKGQP